MAPTRRLRSCTTVSCTPSLSSCPATRLSAPAWAASLLIGLMSAQAMAQNQPAAPAKATDDAATTLPTVTVVAPAAREARAGISGLADTPAWKAPVQAVRLTQDVL